MRQRSSFQEGFQQKREHSRESLDLQVAFSIPFSISFTILYWIKTKIVGTQEPSGERKTQSGPLSHQDLFIQTFFFFFFFSFPYTFISKLDAPA